MNKIHEDAEIAYLGVTIEELARVFNAIPSKYFGLTLDIAHASLLPGGPESFMDAFPNRIVSTHVSDNDLILDRHVPVGQRQDRLQAGLQEPDEARLQGDAEHRAAPVQRGPRAEQAAAGADSR